MRLLVCAGMTGGGVYPALAVLEAVKVHADQVLWIGSQSPMEPALLKGFDLTYKAIPAAGLHGVGLLSLPGNLDRLVRGWRVSKQLISQFKPHVIFYTGGYVGVPVAIAAGKIPSVVFIPDIEPGLALQFLIRRASFIAVSTNDTMNMVRTQAETAVTGYPIRRDLLNWNRASARDHFRIGLTEQILLVFGGSKGSLSINRALTAILKDLLPEMHVIHISGKDNWTEAKKTSQSLPVDLANRYHVFPFLQDDMGAALAAADLAVCRAGASTLGELPAFGLPAILVPYPYAWRYQARNAQYLAQQGGAVVLEDKAMGDHLYTMIGDILHDTARLESMRTAMKNLHIRDAADQIGNLLIKSASGILHKEETNG